jgi:hypothetical protein
MTAYPIYDHAAQIVSIQDLINAHRFNVTDFQRDYEWDPAVAVNLFDGYLDDLTNGLPITLLGMISAYRDSDGSLAVTDGQQRIITLLLGAAAAMRSCLERTEREVGGTLADLLNVNGFGNDGGPRITFPNTLGADRTYNELRRLTADPFPRPSGPPTSQAMLANAAALRTWFDNTFDTNPAGALLFFQELLPRLRVVLQIMPTRQIGIRDFIRQNTNVKPLRNGALIKNIVISHADRLGKTDETVAAWSAFEAGAGNADEREKRIHYALAGNYSTPSAPITFANTFKWFSNNVTVAGVDTDPVAFVRKLETNSATVTATTRKGVGAHTDPRIKCLARLRPALGVHTQLVSAAAGFDNNLFAHTCFRIGGLALVTSVLKKRGGDLRTTFTDAAYELAALHKSNTANIQTVDAVFDAAATKLVDGRPDVAVNALATTRFTERSSLDPLTVLVYAALTFEPDIRHQWVLETLMSGRYQVEHIWPVADDTWDASHVSSFPVLVAPSAERHLLGNLTPLQAPENGSASKGCYTSKLAYYSAEPLTMTRILTPGCDTAGFTRQVEREVRTAREAIPANGPWTADKIVARTDDLARRVLRTAGIAGL